MNGVIGMSQILSETALDATQREYVDIIRGSAKALLSLINDVLDLSKIEADRLELEHVEFDLRDVIYETVAAMALQSAVKGIELIVNIERRRAGHCARRSRAAAPDRHEPDRQCHQIHPRRPCGARCRRARSTRTAALPCASRSPTPASAFPPIGSTACSRPSRKSIPPPRATTAAAAWGCPSSSAWPN